jgi:hypothetical protein
VKARAVVGGGRDLVFKFDGGDSVPSGKVGIVR